MATYITVMVLVIILCIRNVGADRHLAVFSAVFVTIQLLEFFAWLSIEKKDRRLNGLVTRLILIFLWAQPLANSYMALKGSSTNFSKYLMLLAVIVFGVLFLAALVTAFQESTIFKTVVGPRCHLVWKRKVKTSSGTKDTGFMSDHPLLGGIYILGLLLPLLFIKPFRKGLALAIVGYALLVISRKMSSKEEFSSWWCWIAGVFTVVALVLKAK